MRILIAPSGFKESLSAEAVAQAIAAGIRAAHPAAQIVELPLVDGGEGFSETLVRVTGGTLHRRTVTGPIGQPVTAHFGFLGRTKTAVMEMASAAGLRLVPRDYRNPLHTTTFGVGELIRAALEAGAERILFGCGDSGTNDGGAGMAQALGIRLLDAEGRDLERGGAALARLHSIDVSGRDPRLNDLVIDVACNIHNLLCGPKGVARVFGPQKGATPEQVETLARALDRYAEVLDRHPSFGLAFSMRSLPGGGASGGLGAGLHALLGAALHPRYDIVMQYLDLDRYIQSADVVFTAEGAIDYQTPFGKIPAEVARRARRLNVPVIVLAGTVGAGADQNYAHGIAAYTSILERPCTLDDAIRQAPDLTARSAENVMRLVLTGQQLAARP